MKKCSSCAEEIQDEAIKCKHCGERLDGVSVKEKIIITRKKILTFAAARSIEFYLNNVIAGKIKNGESKEFLVSPGENSIYAKIDWCKTYPIKFVINKGELKNFELGTNSKWWAINPITMFYFLIFNPKELLYLKEI